MSEDSRDLLDEGGALEGHLVKNWIVAVLEKGLRASPAASEERDKLGPQGFPRLRFAARAVY